MGYNKDNYKRIRTEYETKTFRAQEEADARRAELYGAIPELKELDESLSPAEKLKVVQGLMKEGDERAKAIYETIGAYFGYTLAYYAEFYEIKHVLIMGRVTSGEGGEILLAKAREVIAAEFPELAKKMTLNIPDEKARRVGQSVAAASLPKLN